MGLVKLRKDEGSGENPYKAKQNQYCTTRRNDLRAELDELNALSIIRMLSPVKPTFAKSFPRELLIGQLKKCEQQLPVKAL